jgi:hypothetical protein
MIKTSQTVKTNLLIDEEPSERFNSLFNELFSESDRGCILIGSSVLDEVLGEYIVNRLSVLNQISTKLSFNSKSSFAAKIKFANNLKFITRDVFEDLERIRVIRNKAAHDYKPRNFKDKEIIDIVHTFSKVEDDPVAKSIEWEAMIDERAAMSPNGVLKGTRRTYEAFVFCITVAHIAGVLDFKSHISPLINSQTVTVNNL